jgi:hypothetical protein
LRQAGESRRTRRQGPRTEAGKRSEARTAERTERERPGERDTSPERDGAGIEPRERTTSQPPPNR